MIEAVGAHIFAGGFTLGMKSAGIRVLGHLEAGNFGVTTAKKNHPELNIRVGADNWKAEDYRGVNVIYCNPPCAAYSAAAAGTAGQDWRDERMSHAYTALGLLTTCRPDVWVLESVCPMLKRGGAVCSRIEETALDLGYSVTYWQHDIKFFGAAQQRRRVFVIAHRYHLEFPSIDLEQSTISRFAGGEVRFRHSKVMDILSAVENPGIIADIPQRLQKWVASTPPGGHMRRVWQRESSIPPGPSFATVRLDGNGISPTVVPESYMWLHPTEDRAIGLNEGAALCGFRNVYEWPGKKTAGWSQLTKAVTPIAGEMLGYVVRDCLEARAPVRWKVAEMNQLAVSPRMYDWRCINKLTVGGQQTSLALLYMTSS